MKNNISFDDAIKLAEVDKHLFKRRENSLLLNDFQISILERNGINYLDYTNIGDLLYQIENSLDNNYDDELDYIGMQLAEIMYYNNTKK